MKNTRASRGGPDEETEPRHPEHPRAWLGAMAQDEKPRVHLSELLAKFDTAMLVTRTADGRLRARPLSFAGELEGRLYFSTSADSPKVAELQNEPRVAITMQDSLRYVSVSGLAEIREDRGLVDRLWRESWRVWFPSGKSDPTLRILSVEPEAAEYWEQSGARGLTHLPEMVKAYATGTKPASGASSDNVKVPIEKPPRGRS
jgi:general stress protein 26